MGELLVLTGLGGLMALDGTSVGQFMVSRPLVAATLAGWVAGSPADGFMVGLLLEIYLLVSFPVGGSRFPEGGPAAVVAAATAAAAPGAGALALGVALGLVWGQVAAVSITVMRTLNSRLAPNPSNGPVTRADVVGGHLSAIGLDLVRGICVSFAGIVTGRFALRVAPPWPLDGPDTRALLLVGGSVSLGILLWSFGGIRRRGLLFAGGLALGALGGALL